MKMKGMVKEMGEVSKAQRSRSAHCILGDTGKENLKC